MTNNRFIPDMDPPPQDELSLLNMHTLLKVAQETIRVDIIELDGVRAYALTDLYGQIVSYSEVLEIMSVVEPFYSIVPSKTVEQYNEQLNIHKANLTAGCAKIDTKRNTEGFVYVLKAGPYYKIGVSKHIDQRIKTLSTLPPFDIDLILTIFSYDMYTLETELHERFADKRKNGEWFELDPEDVAWLQQLKENTNGR